MAFDPDNGSLKSDYKTDQLDTCVVFTNHVIEHFSKNLGWSLEGYRKLLLVYKSGERLEIEAYPTLVEERLYILRLSR